MHKRIFIALFSCMTMASVYSQPRSENRQRTPEENRFYDRIDAAIRKAMPATPANWEIQNETEGNTHILPAWDAPKNKGPYYYSFEKSFTLNNEALQKCMDSISQEIAANPSNADAIVKKMEQFTANSSCMIRVEVNLDHTALSYCSGKVSYPKINGFTRAVRVEAGTLDNEDCRASTQLIIGQFTPLKAYPHDQGNGGTINATSKFTDTQQAFAVHSLVVTIIASAKVADAIIANMDLTSLSALVQP